MGTVNPWQKLPPLPSATEIAERLRAGESIDDIADQYERGPHTIALKLNYAGFSRDGSVRRHGTTDATLIGIPLMPVLEDAACATVDPELFFPDKGNSQGKPKRAVAVCRRCPLATRTKCLQWALDNNERFGIWGGLTAPQRRKLKKGEAA